MKLLHPQEIEVFYVLPALRREITLALKLKGIEQKKIAKLLGLTEAAVSNYVRNKRAKDVTFSDDFKKTIAKASDRITDDVSLFRETQFLLAQSKREGAMCSACKTFSDRDIPQGCNTCFEHPHSTPNVTLPKHLSN